MRRWPLILGLLAFAALCHGQNNTHSCANATISAGQTGTTDSGLVTAYCGIGATPQTALTPGPFYSYGSTPFASFGDAFQPAMDFYYNTADGAANKNPTIIILPEGGNATSGTDWSMGFALTNGSEPPALYALVDGSATGKHYNVMVPQTQSYPSLTLNSASNIGDSTLSVINLAHHYWPSSGSYTVCVDITNQECKPATSTTSPYQTPSTNPFTVTITGTFSSAHAAGVPVWAEDSNGQGGPTYPTWYKWTTCDIARSMSYLNGVMGNHQYVLVSISGTTTPHSNVIAYGQALEKLAAPQGCGYLSADTTWAVVGSEFISPYFDAGFGSIIGTSGLTQNQPAPCANETWAASSAWTQLLGAYGATNSGVGGGTVQNPLTYANGHVTITSPNSLTTAAENLSFPYCVPGTTNSCTFTPNNYLGLGHIDGGASDNSNPCVIQQAATGITGFSGQIQAGVQHGANFNENENGLGNCGTSAAAVGMCNQSYAFNNMVTMLGTLQSSSYALTTSVVGGGTLVCSPLGSIVAGVPVTCTATAGTGYTFGSFTTNTCSFTPSSNTTSGTMPASACALTATFNVNSYTVSTSTLGNGTGTITGCAGSANYGSSVTCTANATGTSVFAGWSGGTILGTTNPQTFTMAAGNVTVNATFNAPGPIAVVSGNTTIGGHSIH